MTDPSDPRRPIERLLEIMARLRDPQGGCPWDLEQSFATIAPYTIEEAYEVADAIVREDWTGLREELGDLLFQVVFHAQMAREAGLFDFDGVAHAIVEKMVRRHPHVFGDARVESAQAQTRAWESHKAAERRAGAGEESGTSILDGVSGGLPAFRRALKLQRKAADAGFDWPHLAGLLDKLREEIAELEAEVGEGGTLRAHEDEIGDLLFACVNLARRLGVEPESALRGANLKFERRFRRMEALLAASGASVAGSDLETLERAWQQVKRGEGSAGGAG